MLVSRKYTLRTGPSAQPFWGYSGFLVAWSEPALITLFDGRELVEHTSFRNMEAFSEVIEDKAFVKTQWPCVLLKRRCTW